MAKGKIGDVRGPRDGGEFASHPCEYGTLGTENDEKPERFRCNVRVLFVGDYSQEYTQ